MVKITKAVCINQRHIEELEKLARKGGETVSFLIQQAIREYLERKATKGQFATAISVAEVGATRIRNSLSQRYPRDAYGTSFITPQAPLADTTPVLRHQKKWRR